MHTKKKARESGYAEILIEGKLETSGTLVSVLSGKAYSKALFNLKAVVEALERLLFEVLAKENDIEIRPEALLNLINLCSSSFCSEQLNKTLQDESVTQITNKYEKNKQENQAAGKYSTSVMVKWPISSLPSMDKITQGEFYFHFFEIPLYNIKILK